MELGSLKPLIWAVIALALLAGVAAALKGRGRKATGAVKAKRPLTEREQGMFFRLTQTFPQHVVLAQVSFSALLVTKDRPTRATFDRKVADFVLCDKAFAVLAVIELDDASHKGRESNDLRRDSLLATAGIAVLRFSQIPDVAVLSQALSKLPPKAI